jgi:hypothetical protein
LTYFTSSILGKYLLESLEVDDTFFAKLLLEFKFSSERKSGILKLETEKSLNELFKLILLLSNNFSGV